MKLKHFKHAAHVIQALGVDLQSTSYRLNPDTSELEVTGSIIVDGIEKLIEDADIEAAEAALDIVELDYQLSLATVLETRRALYLEQNWNEIRFDDQRDGTTKEFDIQNQIKLDNPKPVRGV